MFGPALAVQVSQGKLQLTHDVPSRLILKPLTHFLQTLVVLLVPEIPHFWQCSISQLTQTPFPLSGTKSWSPFWHCPQEFYLLHLVHPVKLVWLRLQLTQLDPSTEGVNVDDLQDEQTLAYEQTAHSLSGQTMHFLLAISL